MRLSYFLSSMFLWDRSFCQKRAEVWGKDIRLAVSHIQARSIRLIFPFPTSVLHLQCPGLSFFITILLECGVK